MTTPLDQLKQDALKDFVTIEGSSSNNEAIRINTLNDPTAIWVTREWIDSLIDRAYQAG